MIKLNARGEVADFQDASQFEPDESEFECGEFAVAIVKFAGSPGKGATGTQEKIDQIADAFYTRYVGPDVAGDTQGTSIDVMHKMIKDCGLEYNDLPEMNSTSQQSSDIAHMKATLAQGYPLIATIIEASVVDLDLGKNPYSWGPSGTHIIVYTGIARDGNVLVRDAANIIGPLQVNNTVQPGPRRYDIHKIATQWATMVWLPWLPHIPAGFDPTTGVINPPFGGNMNIEQSAKDCWESTVPIFAGAPPPYNTEIALAWQQLYSLGKKPGPPISLEYNSVAWDGKPIRVQEFANTRCEWDGQPHWFPQL
ncbi:MAG: C39 family peptidase [Ktedonobacteraceae bacterium]